MAWATTKITIKQQRENRTDLGKCSHQYDEKQGKNNNTQVLFTNCLLRVQEDRQQKKKGVKKTTKEEGSNEEDRLERADVRNVKNEYVN